MMKISLRELRCLIREAMVSPASAAAGGIALYSVSQGDMFDIHILYATRKQGFNLYDSITQDLVDSYVTAARWALVGAVKVALERGPSYIDGVKTMISGYGPLLYDIALKKNGSLRPSPTSVSDDAQRVWNYYENKRSDVIFTKNPTTVKLKSRSSVDLSSLEESHDDLKNSLDDFYRRRGQRFDSGKFEDALKVVAEDLLSGLNM
jgi:hypothetical protein